MSRLRAWWARFALPVVFLAAVSVEGWALFVNRDGAFTIHGRRPYRVAELAQGVPVSHAFLMNGNGLASMSVQFVSNAAASARIRWTLFHGSRDLEAMTPAFSGESTIALQADSRTWETFPLTRDGSSHDRWYTIEVQLLDVSAVRPGADRPRVAVMATYDNPDRGGVLWVGEERKPGSLIMRANWLSTTVYRRFVVEGVPHLSPLLQPPAVQAIIALVLHLALYFYARAILRAADASRDTR